MKTQTYRIAIPEELLDGKGGWEIFRLDDLRCLVKVARGDFMEWIPRSWIVPEKPPQKEWLEGQELFGVAHRIPIGTKAEFAYAITVGTPWWRVCEFYKLSRTNIPSYGVIHGLEIIYTPNVRIHLPSLSESQRKAILGEGE